MKVLLVFAICGLTCSLAASTCSSDETAKCPQGPDLYIANKKDLERVCRHVECYLGIAEKCGADYFGPEGYFPLKSYRKFSNNLCKSAPNTTAYLYKAKCITEALKDNLFKKCGFHERMSVGKEEYCRNLPSGLKCLRKHIVEKCGPIGGSSFSMIDPLFDPYDCMQ